MGSASIVAVDEGGERCAARVGASGDQRVNRIAASALPGGSRTQSPRAFGDVCIDINDASRELRSNCCDPCGELRAPGSFGRALGAEGDFMYCKRRNERIGLRPHIGLHLGVGFCTHKLSRKGPRSFVGVVAEGIASARSSRW